MDFKRYIPDHAVTTVPILALLFSAHYFFSRDEPVSEGIELVEGAPAFYEHWQRPPARDDFDIDAGLQRLEIDDAKQDRLIRELLRQGNYQQARTRLLEVAAAAVSDEDEARLGATLMLLGEVAINQQELSAAEIYLQEALYLSMERDDPMATAQSYRLLGQLNIRARELARYASNSNDELWQARNAISRGFYRGVQSRLQQVIHDDLDIRRYGAAADAWEALASYHDKMRDSYQAQQARIEAARLYASTGQMTHVHRILDGLDRSLIGDAGYDEVETELMSLFERHQQDLIKASQARDYQMLYHHYLRLGEVERAWEFRIKSSATLADGSERLLYQRQADVIAVLFNSNFAMDRARKYLDKAGLIYNDNGVPELLEQTRDLESQIY
jgi:flagellin-specific chaperone FliS